MKKLTIAEKAAIKDARNEKHIQSKDLLSEITPLLDDYFLAATQECEKGISLNFYNGQNFILSVSESD